MKNPYMPLWVDDYLRGTKTMELEENGLYIKIILELWVDGDLPNDHKKLAKIFGVTTRTFTRVFNKLEGKFDVTSEFISHSRVNKERLKMISKSEKNAINGRKGGNAKANAKANATNSLTPKGSNIDIDTNIDSDIDKKKERKKKETAPIVLTICEFYSSQINTEAMSSGKENLEKLHLKTKIPYEELFECVKNYKNSLKPDEFTIRMRNFFGRQARYQDYKESPKMTPQTGSSGPLVFKPKSEYEDDIV